ncbi:hypothetical protein LSTR_LSTR009073 [Laodelphax striatellus]|uniref:Uncharacterized protein n=1 Tax=Laodelphax striatellus TaxID=195883 RepID=A0A482XP44_LAOST|nr:hypothetical protein LSTR_LSTR017329 [Laodelphax striatellus]RZF47537.1 hypothetical protein LSTR_LSTR009073 [Laodelphax striatellus]
MDMLSTSSFIYNLPFLAGGRVSGEKRVGNRIAKDNSNSLKHLWDEQRVRTNLEKYRQRIETDNAKQ